MTLDIERPSAARMYDYYLGGSHNFAVDRAAADAVLAVIPDVPVGAQANRAFLRRAVRYLVEAGVTQFIDIGSGIPTLGNVHEIAQQADPRTRVVYVDTDPVAVAHSRLILGGNERATVIHEDLRRPGEILEHPDVRQLIDFDQPVALMLVAVLHFVSDAAEPPRSSGRCTTRPCPAATWRSRTAPPTAGPRTGPPARPSTSSAPPARSRCARARRSPTCSPTSP